MSQHYQQCLKFEGLTSFMYCRSQKWSQMKSYVVKAIPGWPVVVAKRPEYIELPRSQVNERELELKELAFVVFSQSLLIPVILQDLLHRTNSNITSRAQHGASTFQPKCYSHL